eukprot:TRINITY_DN2381_c0_g1_i6.p1 TRINITY_DN2381_c0_g1~~TRINITY_DN2381_c0_g1_i6.p1  ORF type:complete len:630 (+),score=229.86 TRINITY_DN2381_c0_g1_i6:1339-3228(+)
MCVTFPEEDQVTMIQKKTDRRYDFRFTKVFRPTDTQAEVYAWAGRPLIESVMNGFNAAILAYGQTGSGKTFTMQGFGFDDHKNLQFDIDMELQGIIPRMLNDIFETINFSDAEYFNYQVRVSYIEVYMEKLRDLINTKIKKKLQIRENKKQGIYITDATEVQVRNVQEIMRVMKLGLLNRTVAATKSNFDSSRSHAIFLISVIKNDLKKKVTKTSQLYMVDLAGSEKVSKTEATGMRLKEAQNINASLLSLGSVIYALAEVSEGKKRHIPYRNSKLTRILKNSLGGNARTVLIICCSPSSYNEQETLSTLRFGGRCQLIKNKPTENKHRTIEELEYMLKESETEIKRQAGYIQTLESELRRYANMMSSLGVPKTKLIVSDDFGPSPPKELPMIEDSGAGSSSSSNSSSSSSSSSGSSSKLTRQASLTAVAGPKQSVMDLIASRRSRQVAPTDVTSFLCPLTKQIMTDPVFCSDGYTYERRAILKWLKNKSYSPMTGNKMRHTVVIPNMNLKKQIRMSFPHMRPGDKTDFFQLIPIEIIMSIFAMLPGYTMAQICRVCDEWNELVDQEVLWAYRLEQEYQIVLTEQQLAKATNDTPSRDAYIKEYKKSDKERAKIRQSLTTVGDVKLVRS